jgi:hypothetical protein
MEVPSPHGPVPSASTFHALVASRTPDIIILAALLSNSLSTPLSVHSQRSNSNSRTWTVQYATLLLHSAFYHSVLSTSKITFTSTYIVSTAMSPSEKSLLQRALIDRRQQVFELATSSNALSDLGAELLFLSDGPQKTRMMASLHAANSLIKKQLLEASLVCKVVEINVTPPSTDSAGEKQSGSMLTQLMGIPSVHGDMTVQKALELMGAATAEYSSNRTKLMPFMTVLRKADANSTVEEALEMVQAMALKPDNSEVIVSYIHYGTTEQEADTHSQTPAETADHEESIEDATLDGSSIKLRSLSAPNPSSRLKMPRSKRWSPRLITPSKPILLMTP